MNVIVPIIKIAMGIIWNVMKFLWPLIKTLVVDTWNNIKNIINGALDVILGIVKYSVDYLQDNGNKFGTVLNKYSVEH